MQPFEGTWREMFTNRLSMRIIIIGLAMIGILHYSLVKNWSADYERNHTLESRATSVTVREVDVQQQQQQNSLNQTNGTVPAKPREPMLKQAKSNYTFLFNGVEDLKRFQQRRDVDRGTVSMMKLARRQHLVNCSNSHQIKLGRLLRRGPLKTTYAGTFRGKDVAVVYYRLTNINLCIRRFINAIGNGSLDDIENLLYFTRCEFLPGDTLIYELLNHAVLDYPNIVKNLGYCIRNYAAQIPEQFILTRGTIGVYEFGEAMCTASLSVLPWLERVRHARELANLLELSEYSLLGSVAYTDLRERHFVMAGNSIKLKDLDVFVTSVETKCGDAYIGLQNMTSSSNVTNATTTVELDTERRQKDSYQAVCSFGLPCVGGECVGMNARLNIHAFTEMFFKTMMDRYKIPSNIYDDISTFLDDLFEYKLTATQIKDNFDKILYNSNLQDEPWDYPAYFVL